MREEVADAGLRVGEEGTTSSPRNPACTHALDIMAYHDGTDRHFDHVGQHTQKRLPKLSWRRLIRPGPSGKMMLAIFFGTLAVLTITNCLALMLRA
jgi:hypothetical protein